MLTLRLNGFLTRAISIVLKFELLTLLHIVLFGPGPLFIAPL